MCCKKDFGTLSNLQYIIYLQHFGTRPSSGVLPEEEIDKQEAAIIGHDDQPQNTEDEPILIKGTHGQYIPWQTHDLTSLVSKLPDIHGGAPKWIRAFEEATTGKLLALGDMKAVWAQTLGAPTMENVLMGLSG